MHLSPTPPESIHPAVRDLEARLADDPLGVLSAVGALHRDVADLQVRAARIVAERHSWAAVGEALGVSRQAAHQKYCPHRGTASNCGPRIHA